MAASQSQSLSSAHSIPSAMEAIIDSLNSLKMESGFQDIMKLFKENKELRDELDAMKESRSQLEKSKEEQQDEHDRTYSNLSDTIQRLNNKHSAEQEKLRSKIEELEAIVQRDASARAELENRERQKAEEIDKLQIALRDSNAICKEAKQRVIELERQSEHVKVEIERLKRDSQRKQGSISDLERSKQAIMEKQARTIQSLESTQKDLANIRGLAIGLKTEDSKATIARMESLWESASSVIQKHLPRKLPENGLADNDLWNRLRSAQDMTHSVPLPRSDSIAARDMRYAVTIAFLFHKLDLDIFQPNYLMDDEFNIRNELLDQAIHNSGKESFSRAFLLSLCEERQFTILQARASLVVENVIWLVERLLTADQTASFRRDLQAFVEAACTIWQTIQRLETRYEPNLEYAEDEGIEWQTLPIGDGSSAQSTQAPAKTRRSDQEELVVFPRLYIVKDSKPCPVTQGIVLWKSQTLAAAKELRDRNPPSPTFGRSDLSRPRSRRGSQPANNATINFRAPPSAT